MYRLTKDTVEVYVPRDNRWRMMGVIKDNILHTHRFVSKGQVLMDRWMFGFSKDVIDNAISLGFERVLVRLSIGEKVRETLYTIADLQQLPVDMYKGYDPQYFIEVPPLVEEGEREAV